MEENEDFEKEIMASHKMLRNYAIRLTKNEKLAEDLLQETLLRILMNNNKYDNRGKFNAWAKTIMKHIFLNEKMHSEKRMKRFVDGYDYMKDDSVHPLVEENDYRNSKEDLEKAIKMLSPKYAQIITLQMSGYKYEEIAEKLDMSMGYVKSTLFSAKGHLRKFLNS